MPREQAELQTLHRRLDAALSPGARLEASLLHNDLEPAALSLCPEIADAMDAARQSGADQAMVCGSGPTVIGVFWGDDASARAGGATTALGEQFPRAAAASPISSWPCGTI